MHYKTKDDVLRVISKQKPDTVINMFIESYLLGVALQPYFELEEEYQDLLAQEDVPDVDPIVDPETLEVLTEGYSPNALRDARIAELEGLYPYLADPEDDTSVVERRPVPVVDIEQWKVEHYAVLRQSAYGTWQEQLERIYDGTWEEHITTIKGKYKKTK